MQYEFMISRLRTTDPKLRPVLRSTANPIGPGVGWILDRFRWWLYRPGVREEEHAGPYLAPGRAALIARDPLSGVDRIVRASEELRCSSCGAAWRASAQPPPAELERCRHLAAQSRCFIPSRLADNPQLAVTDYADRLGQLDPFTRSKLLDGDWMSEQRGGDFFRREWFPIVDACPAGVRARVRYWDRAATVPGPGRDPDWTVGLLCAAGPDGALYVEDVVRDRLDPAGVEALILRTAAADHAIDPRTVQALEQDPGQAGVVEVQHLIRALVGHDVRPVRPSGDKQARARPVAAQASAGNVRLVRDQRRPGGPSWIATLLTELQQFPDGAHDDQTDSLSGAVGFLAQNAPAASRWYSRAHAPSARYRF